MEMRDRGGSDRSIEISRQMEVDLEDKQQTP